MHSGSPHILGDSLLRAEKQAPLGILLQPPSPSANAPFHADGMPVMLPRAENTPQAGSSVAPAEGQEAQGSNPCAVGELVQRDAAWSAAGESPCLPQVTLFFLQETVPLKKDSAPCTKLYRRRRMCAPGAAASQASPCLLVLATCSTSIAPCADCCCYRLGL